MSSRAQHVDEFEDLGGGQAELGFRPHGRGPAPDALAAQLHPHADRRAHAVPARVLEDQLQLLEVLHHRDDVAAEFRRQRRHLDVAVVLEPVADDGPVAGVTG
jgi:hypothetical protein